MSDMTEDMDAEVDRQDRVIQGLRDEIERLTAESKAKDVAYETMQKYVTELEARIEELETELNVRTRELDEQRTKYADLVVKWARLEREQGEKE